MLRIVGVTPTELIKVGVGGVCGVSDTEFNSKHWGAALIAAGLLASDPRTPPATEAAIVDQAERLMVSKARWLPAPITAGRGDSAGEPAHVVDVLVRNAASLHLLGHDTIFATLVLRAMSDHPELAASANVDALVSMVEFAATAGPGGPFPGWDDPASVTVDSGDEVPPIRTMEQLSTSALTAFSGAGTVYDGFDRGVVQHVLTHTHALVELDRLGHASAVRAGVEAHRTYRKLMTRRPSDGERPLPVAAQAPDFFGTRYWRGDLRGSDDWLFGHVFKVALAWTTLQPLATSRARARALPMLATSMHIT